MKSVAPKKAAEISSRDEPMKAAKEFLLWCAKNGNQKAITILFDLEGVSEFWRDEFKKRAKNRNLTEAEHLPDFLQLFREKPKSSADVIRM